MAFYKQPEFYRNFKCMGGKCPNSCCAIWRIDWTKKEVENLKAADCSPELRNLIDESFIPREDDENMMAVKLLSANKFDCPFLTEDRMCRIQRELGEEYLSHTCQSYPRTMFICNNIVTRTCSASCYQVMKTICTDKNAMKLVSAPLEASQVIIHVTPDSPETLKKHPELKYRNELFDFFYDIIGNTKRSLETSLLLGALAAQKLTEYISRGEHERIPEIIKTLRPQLNAQTIPSFENAKPNYGISLGLVGKLVDTFQSSDALTSLKENEKLSAQKYEQGRALFNEYLNQNPYFLRNLALNFLFEGRMPFYNPEMSLFENYCYYASTIAAVKLLGASISLRDKSTQFGFFVSVSFFIRSMYHSPYTLIPPKILSILKENGLHSPSFIALMLK